MSPVWERRERRERRGFGGRERGFGRKPWMRDEEKPVKEGEVHTVTISEVSRRGDGIARIKNFVIFVSGAKKGDTVKVKIKEVRGNHATAEIVSEEAPAEHIEEVAEKEGEPKNNSEGAEGKPEGSA